MDESNLNSKSAYHISMVVPCYNCESTLKKTMDSLLNQMNDVAVQDYYQIVLVDDGSSDGTGDVCDGYASIYHNIKVVHKQNGGLVDAWKTGVNEAEGEYIAFCDADDYIDGGFVITIHEAIMKYLPDMIIFGVKIHFDNDEEQMNDIRLSSGYYDRKGIEKKVFPKYFSDGEMQSEMFFSSRWNKVYKKKLLLKIVDDVPNKISFGEDDVTCFASILNANSVFVINSYFPYHYVRSATSMIGKYDDRTFDKINYLFDILNKIAEKYGYTYLEQLKREYLSLFYLYAKKEIFKNPHGFRAVRNRLRKVKNSEYYTECYAPQYLNKYQFPNRIFANMIANEIYFLPYILVKVIEKIRGRNV